MSAPLRVAFDCTPAISGRTGIARYVNELGPALEREGVELRRFSIGRSSFPAPPRTRHLPVPSRAAYGWWRRVRWPTVERLTGGADVVHATGLLVPATKRPLVITVHDIAAYRRPDLHPPRHVAQQASQLRELHRADAIVTVSGATADDLAELGIVRERVVVAPLGLTPLPEAVPLAPARRPPGSYLLTVGETSPRKDYAVVLHALARLDRSIDLVMAGPAAGDEPRLRSLIEDLGLGQRVWRLGAVSDPELAGLYRGAVALCFPSVAEGFGLPVLEAMAAATPVIARDIPVVRELAGDAALYVESADADAWREAIEGVIADERRRGVMIEAGRRRAGELTWARTAEATHAAYRVALEAARRNE